MDSLTFDALALKPALSALWMHNRMLIRRDE